MNPLNVTTLLRQFNLHPKKSLGQNFLVDEAMLACVADTADLTADDTVLEIGPGLGSLTRHLATRAQHVVAVELDDTLLPVLRHVLTAYSNVEIIHRDILKLNLPAVMGDAPYKVVANIPYNITSAIVRYLLEAPTRPSVIVLTIQREVAERICATPGDMSLLAVSVQFYARPTIVAHIPADAFHPRPAVDSAVVRLEVLPRPAVVVDNVDDFFRVVKAGFSQKRKQIRNSLSGGLALKPTDTDALLACAQLDPKRRAETLTLEEWATLTQVLTLRE